ncbi:hypothetical protein Shyd_19090 [Streptomyces hydrogenans]|uniref:Uncharacterized protein n=1 Tax=Streptomyces hydrogenans TaxID=1873719 RepID=A0ABQ3P686_9ACTN|nr:hypothetical protein Shyd_19090 [Streptomyces hydrogenans]
MSTDIEPREHTELRAASPRSAAVTAPLRPGPPCGAEAGKLGYLGVNLPEEYGGGGRRHGRAVHRPGGGRRRRSRRSSMIGRLARDLRHGHLPLRHRGAEGAWLPGLADGSRTMAFGITEPDAGSNSHRINHDRHPHRRTAGSLNGPEGLRLGRRQSPTRP